VPRDIAHVHVGRHALQIDNQIEPHGSKLLRPGGRQTPSRPISELGNPGEIRGQTAPGTDRVSAC
jgi:hypothetical protein